MKWVLFAIAVLAPAALQATPLETAKALAADTFKGWTYGNAARKKTIDCVQFMEVVIAKEVGRPLTAVERQTIAIHHGWSAEEVQAKAADGKDPKVSGLAHALVDLMQVATRVEPSEARVGDFVQYWKQNEEGSWFGHSSLLSSVSDGKARLYGSHKSTNGIADSNFELKLTGDDRHVFLVRLQEGLQHNVQRSQDGTLWLPKGMSTYESAKYAWTLPMKRWGMYQVKAHFAAIPPKESTLTLLGKSTAESHIGRRVYFAKPVDYPVSLTCKDAEPELRAISLIPAPEGSSDLAESDGKVVLHSRDATVFGQVLRYEPNPKKLCLGFWANEDDRAEWVFEIETAGTFDVEIDQGCGKGHGGSSAYVSSSGQELTFTVQDTGHFQNFRTRTLGKLTLSAGMNTLTVGAHKKSKGAVMDVCEIRLVREAP
ncbi:MAG: hypothetical protein GWQ05_08390 [Verrucomicrobiaceae bacterium]|nr:hypothetical protein [Verrucomicrobiaceae bacterium]